MLKTTDLMRAAAIAQDAPIPTTLTMLPEGVEILIQSGDLQTVFILGWDRLDGSELGLAHWVEYHLAAFRHERDAALAQLTGSRPFRPERRLP